MQDSDHIPDLGRALDLYKRAAEYVESENLLDEVIWQRDAKLELVSESTFLREFAWVILCSGFRETIIRRIFDHISLCFCDWESSVEIIASYPACYYAAQASFANKRKLSAIVDAAFFVDARGFEVIKLELMTDPVRTLRQFPYIGPVTVWHLAKNLGYNTSKPDRHLVRAALQSGFSNPSDFCMAISNEMREPLKVVDLIIWRYIADHGARAIL